MRKDSVQHKWRGVLMFEGSSNDNYNDREIAQKQVWRGGPHYLMFNNMFQHSASSPNVLHLYILYIVYLAISFGFQLPN